MAPRSSDQRAVHHRVRLRTGDRVLVRSLRPDDEAGLGAMFDDLSNSSRYQRFLAGKPSVSARALRRLVDVDHRDHVALVAVAPDGEDGGDSDGGAKVIGEARWVRDEGDPTLAEMAITVADDWQQRGLGTALADDLARRAVEEGVDRFAAEVLTDNDGIRRLVEHVGDVDRAEQGDGTAILHVPTGGHDGATTDDGTVTALLRSAARGDFLVVPRPLRWWLRLSNKVTRILLTPVSVLLRRS
ncbi:MAG TPA: GNAT family N-acetyltransferase [Actinomycetospora sp.]|nr:GNAT family N-acetyltransferase [Actinomycetospora sp.]